MSENAGYPKQTVLVRDAHEFEAAAKELLTQGWQITPSGVRIASAHAQNPVCTAVFEKQTGSEASER